MELHHQAAADHRPDIAEKEVLKKVSGGIV
jgi:hypothetical protein